MKEIRVPVRETSVSLSVHGEGPTVVALGPGAGGTRQTPFLVDVAEALAASGRAAVLFNFPYSESRRRLPDPPAVLEETVGAVAQHARGTMGARRLVLGGKSMGGRIASQAVAAGLPADALVFLGYPLHPPGRFETLRDRHLLRITAPMLFVQGTRDTFARWDLLQALLETLGPRVSLLTIEEGNHSFRVPRKTGRTAAQVQAALIDGVLSWLAERKF